MRMPNYLYVSGYISALNSKLFNDNDLERMIDSNSATHAFKILNDTDYSNSINDYSETDFEKVLEDDLIKDKNQIRNEIPDDFILQILFYKYDFNNIATLLKHKYLNSDLEQGISMLGLIDINILKNIIIEDKKESVDLYNIIVKLKKEINSDTKPKEIDYLVDKEYFNVLLDLAEKNGNEFILRFVKINIDIANLRILQRINSLRLDKNLIKSDFISGGNIKNYIKYIKNDNIEKYIEKLEIDYLSNAKYLTLGPELVFYYFWKKEQNNRNIRTIISGKLNNIDKEEIRNNIVKIYE